ncbi:hypothetical protein DFH27DRAFT_21420 [Peziza echinospora]|nr:hypothetical protein DFH27DRAFT_21420 [Peziza echinospora]
MRPISNDESYAQNAQSLPSAQSTNRIEMQGSSQNYQQYWSVNTQYGAQPEYMPMASSPCPPGCTCGYSSINGSFPNQQPQYTNAEYYDNYASDPSISPAPTVDYAPSAEPAQESGKYPFELISQAIARGIVGSSTALNLDPSAFRRKLDCADSQRLSSLLFFKSFTQKDVNLQCALILQVITYWSLEETMPSHITEDDYEEPTKRSRSSRRESAHGSSKRRNRVPPPPRYWTRLENAAVIGMMLGLPFDLLKLTLQESNTDLRLGDVDAILDTNSIEALELFQSGNLPSRSNQRGRKRQAGSSSPREYTPQTPTEEYGDIRMGYNNQ